MSYATRHCLLAILIVGQALALTYCTTPAPVDAIAAAEAQAAAAEVRAARLDSTARYHYALAQEAEDSATFYHLQAIHVQATAIDTAALRRFFANY
jgi:hypothetical protein